MTNPTPVLAAPLAKRWAVGFGLNFRKPMASWTRAAMSLLTVGNLFRTRETVVIETLARRATSTMLIFLVLTDNVSDLQLHGLILDVRGRDVFADLNDFQGGDVITAAIHFQCLSDPAAVGLTKVNNDKIVGLIDADDGVLFFPM